MEVIVNDISHKKNLGQYFSGLSVASLLAYLAKHNTAESIIDPMIGTGDMIAVCNPIDNNNKEFYGVEIDRDVWNKSAERFKTNPNVTLLQGNAFDLRIIEKLAKRQYDLVITNPPYVRYQTIAENKNNTPENLDTREIKRNLITSLDLFKHLDSTDKELFKILISAYSGLSDLAVPSWFLCALLTKIDGRIAMVVPQTWLNRDYATVIHYLLLRWFEIEYIVEDGHSVWFPDAQIKTTLIVAKRIKRRKTILDWGEQHFSYCTIFSKMRKNGSLVGQLFPNSSNPEKEFLNIINSTDNYNSFFKSKYVSLTNFAQELDFKLYGSKWYRTLEPVDKNTKVRKQILKVPSHLKDWLGGTKPQFQSFKDIGLNISQGLRTGANTFFYLSVITKKKDGVLAMPNKPFSKSPILIPNGCFKYVIKKQNELIAASYTVSGCNTNGIALDLKNGLSSSDMSYCEQVNIHAKSNFTELPNQLSDHIKIAENTNVGTSEKPKYIPKLSAVQTNIRKWNTDKPEIAPRFWYMLPQFTKRHEPDLFVPRVNGSNPITRLNPDSEYLIDANFSTIWISETESQHDVYSSLALLNSSWCVVAMEEYGTVMGGGALKLEATQIRKIPIPVLEMKAISELSILGKNLIKRNAKTKNILNDIDVIVLKYLGIEKKVVSKLSELISLKHELLTQRTSK